MRTQVGVAMASGVAVAAVAGVLVLSSGSSAPRTHRADAGSNERTASAAAAVGSRGPREDCSTRSEASFPGAFTSSRNLVVGPLVLVGGAFTPASTVREFGGNKFPLLVRAGHTVTVRLAGRSRRVAALAYGPLPQGPTRLRDAHQTVTFVACGPGRPSRHYRPQGPSGSYADGIQVTFWSGFVLARAPSCVALDIQVDDEPALRRVGLSLGRRCHP